jgi:hypothetical protein
MSIELKTILDRVRHWPVDRQLDAAAILSRMDALGTEPYRLSAEERADLTLAMSEVARGEVADAAEESVIRRAIVPQPEPVDSQSFSSPYTLKAFGEAWLGTHQTIVATLPVGTILAVNLADGRYVTAANGVAAMSQFETQFGKDAWAWVHEVGVPITLGGGLWSLSSEA